MNADEEPLDFWIDLARVGFEDDLHRLMTSAGINRTDLAEAAGVSAAFVSKVLNGSTNYTLKTMAKLARAVGGVLQVRLTAEDAEVVRVVSPETAAWLDDRGFSTVRFEQEPASAEVIDLVSRRASSGFRTEEYSDTATEELRLEGGIGG